MKPSVLILDDELKLRKLMSRIISLEGYQVSEAGSLAEGRTVLERGGIQLLLCDVRLPDGNGVDFTREVKQKYPSIQIILLTAFGNISDGVKATKNGAFDYLVKGDDNDKIIPLLAQASELTLTGKHVSPDIDAAGTTDAFQNIIGESLLIREAVALAKKVAPTEAAVLLTGETGTGKEVFARAIHMSGARKGKAYVALNCSSFSKELLESALFGHRAGSFTGASRNKKGLIEEADGGTLFLDEIGELPLDLQPKLLRVLEDGSYYAIGDTKPKMANVRIIAATNRPLKSAIMAGTFRSDLYYRVAVFHIELPSLRERPEDIALLAQHFVRTIAAKMGKRIGRVSEGALAVLRQYSWEGNIRELKNAIERSMILEDGDQITTGSLPIEVRNATDSIAAFDMASVEKMHIRKALIATNNNKAEAARLLNIGIATLYRKMADYGLRE
jgi:two-component system NtrC family response regulator